MRKSKQTKTVHKSKAKENQSNHLALPQPGHHKCSGLEDTFSLLAIYANILVFDGIIGNQSAIANMSDNQLSMRDHFWQYDQSAGF